MKIWYQSYTPIGFNSEWKNYEEDLKSYVQKVSRKDTEVSIHGVGKLSPQMTESDYIQFMHVSQVIENALQAEREGYDAFAIGGTLDLGHIYLREVLDIPVAFISESSFYNACLLARKFGIVAINEIMLRRQMDLVKYHGLDQRCVPGAHLDSTMLELVVLSRTNPERVISMFTEASEKLIMSGAGAIVPGFGATSCFFGQHDIHDISGIPIVDNVAVVIKTAEMLADLRNLGVNKSRMGLYSYVSKEELIAARKLYGVE